MAKKISTSSRGKSYNYGGGRRSGRIPDFTIREFGGLNTEIKDPAEIPVGQSPDSLNWVTGRYKDHIELRGGYALLGTTKQTGTGRVTGLGIGTRYDGTQIPFFTHGKKAKYYDVTTNDVIEIGSDLLPAGASTDDVSIAPYQNLAGSFIYMSSPNSSIYKVPVANPGSAVDQLSNTYRGQMKIGQSRMFLWNRKDNYGGKDQTAPYLSYIDKALLSSYTETTAENIGTGNGATKTYAATLAFKAAGSKRTCMYVRAGAPIASGFSITAITAASQAVVTVASHTFNIGDIAIIQGVVGMTQINNLICVVVGTTATTITLNINSGAFSAWSSAGTIYPSELISDDRNGVMTGVAGGTGTVNYATGALSVTFNTAPLNSVAIVADYFYEDATNNGICDFTFSTPRTAGQGNVYRQDDGGGNLQVIFPLNNDEYCLHTLKIWDLSIPTADTGATNLQYRSGIGCPYFRGAYPTGDGILFIDNSNPAKPRFRALQIQVNSPVNTVVPVSLSDMLDFGLYDFSQAVVYRYADYDILAAKPILNGAVQPNNSVMFVRDRFSGVWDKLDYPVSCLETYNGTLISGDSLSNNCFTLFSGYDDDGTTINNYWLTGQMNMGLSGIKKFYRLVIRGLIQTSQNIEISLGYDGGTIAKVYTISGTGPYVSKGKATTIGSPTCGSKVVGGGTSPVVAYPFEVDIPVSSSIFEEVQLMVAANNIGFAQVDSITFKDIRSKGRKNLPANTV